jgi:hypothetical protein
MIWNASNYLSRGFYDHHSFYLIEEYYEHTDDSGIKVFNHLPHNIKNLSRNVKQFKSALKKFLLRGSFYTLEEYFGWISTSELATFM